MGCGKRRRAMLNTVAATDPHIDRFVMAMAGEKKVLEIHKHWIVMVWPVVRLLFGLVFVVWATFIDPITLNLIFWQPTIQLFWFVWLVGFSLGSHATYRILDEYRDRFMISTIRLGWFHGVLSTKQSLHPDPEGSRCHCRATDGRALAQLRTFQV